MVQEEGKKLVTRSVSWAATQVLNTHTREERIAQTQERNAVVGPLMRHENMNSRSGSAVVNVI